MYSLKELTHEQYLNTFTASMVNVTETAEPSVDIWPYVNRNQTGTCDHVLLPTNQTDRVVSLIVDISNKQIIGYYVLDLAKQYGLRKD